jgi:hypothetical protein
MKPIKQSVTNATIGGWIPTARQSYGTAGFTVHPQTSTAGTYSVEFTESDLQKTTRVDFTRSTTSLTINAPLHGLTALDACIVSGQGDFEGAYEVASVTDANNIVVTVADSGAASGSLSFTPVVIDIITGFSAADATVRASGNLFASVTGIRMNATSVTGAPIDFLFNQREA